MLQARYALNAELTLAGFRTAMNFLLEIFWICSNSIIKTFSSKSRNILGANCYVVVYLIVYFSVLAMRQTLSFCSSWCRPCGIE